MSVLSKYIEEPAPTIRKLDSVAGFYNMFIAACCFSVRSFLLKYLYKHNTISSFEVIYWRTVVMLTIQLSFIKYSGNDMFAIPYHLKSTVFIRSICEFVGVTSYFTSL